MSNPSKPIQGPLPGFLSLLNLKNLGLLPDTLQGNVQPVFDLEKYFLRGQIIMATEGVTIPAGSSPGAFYAWTGVGNLNGDTAIVVPNNEWWWVENLSAQSSQLSAGDTLFMAPGFTVPVVGAFKVGPEVGGAGVAVQAQVVASAYDFWLPPGSTPGLFLQAAGIVGLHTIAGRMRYTRLVV